MNEFVAGELLVGFRSETIQRQVGPWLHSAISSSRAELVSGTSTERISLPKGMSVIDAMSYYQSRPEVAYAEPNYYRELAFTPNDTQYAIQSQLRQIHCDDAWSITKGKSSVVIAIIDTGIDKNHPDLKNKIVAGWDFVGNDPDPHSTHVHGSHTAGLAGADTNNGIGVAGAGFNSRIMPIRVSTHVTASQSAMAIRFAADHGAKVISMSYAGSGSSSTERTAADYAWNKGCQKLATAGNRG
jgi:thermitase